MRLTLRQYEVMKEYGKFKPNDYIRIEVTFKYKDFELLDKIRALHRRLLEEGIKITFNTLLLELIEKGYKDTKNILG